MSTKFYLVGKARKPRSAFTRGLLDGLGAPVPTRPDFEVNVRSLGSLRADAAKIRADFRAAMAALREPKKSA